MISTKCPVCKKPVEAFLSADDIPEDAKYYICELCLEKNYEKVFVINRDNMDYVFVSAKLFNTVFKKLPDSFVAILSNEVYIKLKSLLARSPVK